MHHASWWHCMQQQHLPVLRCAHHHGAPPGPPGGAGAPLPVPCACRLSAACDADGAAAAASTPAAAGAGAAAVCGTAGQAAACRRRGALPCACNGGGAACRSHPLRRGHMRGHEWKRLWARQYTQHSRVPHVGAVGRKAIQAVSSFRAPQMGLLAASLVVQAAGRALRGAPFGGLAAWPPAALCAASTSCSHAGTVAGAGSTGDAPLSQPRAHAATWRPCASDSSNSSGSSGTSSSASSSSTVSSWPAWRHYSTRGRDKGHHRGGHHEHEGGRHQMPLTLDDVVRKHRKGVTQQSFKVRAVHSGARASTLCRVRGIVWGRARACWHAVHALMCVPQPRRSLRSTTAGASRTWRHL